MIVQVVSPVGPVKDVQAQLPVPALDECVPSEVRGSVIATHLASVDYPFGSEKFHCSPVSARSPVFN